MQRPVIITLSTIPPRFGLIGPALQSLLAQDPAPQAVEVWIPARYRRFPDWDGSPLPDLPPGVTLRRCDTDHGPGTKILPALQAWRGQDVELLFCDDDHIYPPGWLAAFLAARHDHPDDCIAGSGDLLEGVAPRRRPAMRPRSWQQVHRAAREGRPGQTLVARSGYADRLAGWAGAMVRPDFFTGTVFDIPPVLWAVDDPWLSGDLERNGVAIWAPADIPRALRSEAAPVEALMWSEIEDHDRLAADAACVAYYRQVAGIWPPPSPMLRLARRWLPLKTRRRIMALMGW